MDNKTIRQKFCPEGFELIAYHPGQTKGYVELKCRVCGHKRTKRLVSFRGVWAQCRTHCPECDWLEREVKHKELERIKNKKERERALAITGEQLSFNICPVCSEAFVPVWGRKFCSKECTRKAGRVNYKHKRRTHLAAQIVDRDITLKGLALRDNNVCWICNGIVDWSDYVKTDSFIVGERYPSIDHVIPLSKNGLHSWQNVRLAHFGCNRDKGAEIV